MPGPFSTQRAAQIQADLLLIAALATLKGGRFSQALSTPQPPGIYLEKRDGFPRLRFFRCQGGLLLRWGSHVHGGP